MVVAPVRVRVIEEVAPFGDVPLAPSAATGRSEAELARAIMGLRESAPPSHASEAVARLASVGALMRRAARADAGARKRAA